MNVGGLTADLRVERRDGPGRMELAVQLQAPPGGVVALLGPNGAGKTTTLRALAGLQPLTGGWVRLDGRTLEDTATGVRVPPERRRVGVVFQDYLLFGHLSARDNIAFGLRAQGVDRRSARVRAGHWLDRFGLADRGAARPAQLSGGEAQRVALARALAVEPGLLVLDEPLAALDAGTRMAVRTNLRRHLDGYDGVTVLVTHDPLDALVLADTLVVLESGRVVQTGTPGAVARAPQTEFVARLVGLNLLPGTASGPASGPAAGAASTEVSLAGGGRLTVTGRWAGPVYVAVRPAAIALHPDQPHGSPRNVWPGRVRSLEARAEGVRLAVAGPPDVLVDITAAALAELRLVPGAPVWCAVKASELDVYRAGAPAGAATGASRTVTGA